MGYWDEEYIDCNSSFCFSRCSRCKFKYYYVCDKCWVCKKCIEHKLPPEKIDEKGCKHTIDERCPCTEEELEKTVIRANQPIKLPIANIERITSRSTISFDGVVETISKTRTSVKVKVVRWAKSKGQHRVQHTNWLWLDTKLFKTNSPYWNQGLDIIKLGQYYRFEVVLDQCINRYGGLSTNIYLIWAWPMVGSHVNDDEVLTLDIIDVKSTTKKNLFLIKAESMYNKNGEVYVFRYYHSRGELPNKGISDIKFSIGSSRFVINTNGELIDTDQWNVYLDISEINQKDKVRGDRTLRDVVFNAIGAYTPTEEKD